MKRIKFSSKADLKRNLTDPLTDFDRDGGFNNGIETSFEAFRERVILYDRYKDSAEVFQTDYRKEWKQFVSSVVHGRKSIPIDEMMNNITWRNWLFDFCFGDV